MGGRHKACYAGNYYELNALLCKFANISFPLSEMAIRYIKTRTVMATKENLSWDFRKFLDMTVRNWNNIPKECLGNLKPIQLTSRFADPVKRAAMKKMFGDQRKMPNYQDYIKEQKKYERKKNALKAGQLVLLRAPNKKLGDKASHDQVRATFLLKLPLIKSSYRS